MISGLRSIASVLVCANAVLGHTEARAGELATDVKALLGASKLDPRCVGYSIIDLDNSAVLAKYNDVLEKLVVTLMIRPDRAARNSGIAALAMWNGPFRLVSMKRCQISTETSSNSMARWK